MGRIRRASKTLILLSKPGIPRRLAEALLRRWVLIVHWRRLRVALLRVVLLWRRIIALLWRVWAVWYKGNRYQLLRMPAKRLRILCTHESDMAGLVGLGRSSLGWTCLLISSGRDMRDTRWRSR